MMDDTIPTLVDDSMNDTLTMIPYLEEIFASFFAQNKDSVPGPDEFEVAFY